MTMRTACFLLSALLVTAAYPLDARAQPKPPAAAQVGQLFDQAQAAFAKGDKQGAYEAYKAAWALQKSYDIAANLGNVELKLGKHRDAAEHLAFSVDNFPPTGDEALLKLTEKKLAEATKEVGRLHVQVTAGGARAEGVRVTVNGAPVATPLASTLFVNPGEVVVEAKLAGYLDGRQKVLLDKGDARSVSLALVPLSPPRRSMIPGAVMGGAAGAALIAGIVLEVVAANQRSEVESTSGSIRGAHRSCVSGAGNYDARCPDLIDTAHSADRLHDAGIGVLVGAAALGAGAAVYFLWPASTPSRASALRAAPLVSTTGAGVGLSGSF